MLLSSAQRLAEYLNEERKGLQLKHHGYLAIREWVLIQNPGEEYQWYDYTLELASDMIDVSLTNFQLVLHETGEQ